MDTLEPHVCGKCGYVGIELIRAFWKADYDDPFCWIGIEAKCPKCGAMKSIEAEAKYGSPGFLPQ